MIFLKQFAQKAFESEHMKEKIALIDNIDEGVNFLKENDWENTILLSISTLLGFQHID